GWGRAAPPARPGPPRRHRPDDPHRGGIEPRERGRALRRGARMEGVRAGPATSLRGPPGADPSAPARARRPGLTVRLRDGGAAAYRTTTSPRMDWCRAQKYG